MLRIVFVIALNISLFAAWKVIYNPLKFVVYYSGFAESKWGEELFGNDVPDTYITNKQKSLDILHYNLIFDLHPEEKLLKGDVTITGLFKDKNVNQIDLNFYDNFDIKRITLNEKTISNFFFTGTTLSIPVAATEFDTFNVRIIYEGTPKKKGFASFVFDKFNNRSVSYTLSEPIYASTWYPCNDTPDDKALVDIQITNDSSKISISNGKLIEVITNKERRTYHWKTFYPISTYLVCIYSADYKYFKQEYTSISNDKFNFDYYAFPEHLEMAKKDFDEHPEIMKFFEEKFGVYSFPKEKYGVAEFLWQLGAMEHQTITGIGSNFLNGNKMFSEFYIHELAHQWWGDAVGLKSWKDIWLNEGFATYSEALYAEHKAGFDAYKSTMLSKFQDNFAGTLYNPINMFGSTVYGKGAWTLHMLRFEVGDSTFFTILKEYYKDFKYGNASTYDFIKLCERISGKDLDFFFKQWVFEGEGIIKLKYNFSIKSIDSTENEMTLTVKQVQKDYSVYKFPLEVMVKTENDEESFQKVFYVDKKEQTFKLSTSMKIKDILIDPNNWLLAKIQKEDYLK
ncbi:MAG: M1 family metallopeptidase [Ignavibacteriales bacterium]|nr:M1 family metallopeptidase [Ignavibacteriales bacterium]